MSHSTLVEITKFGAPIIAGAAVEHGGDGIHCVVVYLSTRHTTVRYRGDGEFALQASRRSVELKTTDACKAPGVETAFFLPSYVGWECYAWSYATDDELRLVFVKNNA